jgi:hypothetical protein
MSPFWLSGANATFEWRYAAKALAIVPAGNAANLLFFVCICCFPHVRSRLIILPFYFGASDPINGLCHLGAVLCGVEQAAPAKRPREQRSTLVFA